jgi:hypothetical protein
VRERGGESDGNCDNQLRRRGRLDKDGWRWLFVEGKLAVGNVQQWTHGPLFSNALVYFRTLFSWDLFDFLGGILVFFGISQWVC